MDMDQFCNSSCKITKIHICAKHESIKLKGCSQKALSLSSSSDSADSDSSDFGQVKRGWTETEKDNVVKMKKTKKEKSM